MWKIWILILALIAMAVIVAVRPASADGPAPGTYDPVVTPPAGSAGDCALVPIANTGGTAFTNPCATYTYRSEGGDRDLPDRPDRPDPPDRPEPEPKRETF